jgi:hypothetical protein
MARAFISCKAARLKSAYGKRSLAIAARESTRRGKATSRLRHCRCMVQGAVLCTVVPHLARCRFPPLERHRSSAAATDGRSALLGGSYV